MEISLILMKQMLNKNKWRVCIDISQKDKRSGMTPLGQRSWTPFRIVYLMIINISLIL